MNPDSNSAPPLDWKVLSINEQSAPSLASFRGTALLILFFSRGCPSCLSRAIPFSLQVRKVYPEVNLVGIHTRFEGARYSSAQVGEIVKLHHIPYPVYRDQGHETFDLMGAEGTPHWVLLDEQGNQVRSIFGSMPNALQRLDYLLQEWVEQP